MERTPATYILASQKRGTLYTGVTSMPIGRMIQHRDELIEGFTSKYGVKRLGILQPMLEWRTERTNP